MDEPSPGAPRRIGDDVVERVLVETLESLLRAATHCRTRSMAAKCGLNSATVARIWQPVALKPHRHETLKLSKDPQFLAKGRDIVGLYLHPPGRAVVLRVDENVQIQSLDRTQPGLSERRTHDYRRHGPTGLFAALDIATGRVIGKCYPWHRAVEFREFLKGIDAAVPPDLEIHLVLADYGTHRITMIHDWLAMHPHLRLHFTPTRASWINQVQRWFADLTECQIRRGTHRGTKELDPVIEESQTLQNENPKPFVWTKSADRILESLNNECQGISETGH